MIIYIHGFGSSGQGGKSKLFREYLKSRNIPFIAPSLSYVPELAISTLEEIIESCDKGASLIGSSLGGYYAVYLAEKYGIKAALINPSIYPYHTLQRVVGITQNFYDGSRFEWKDSHIKMLEKYDVAVADSTKYMLLLQTGDEVLDYREALTKLGDAKVVLEEGGSHVFDGIERHFDSIIEFLSHH